MMGKKCERHDTDQTVAYIGDMLIELRSMSQQTGKPMLTYLIEMAMVEAVDAKGKNEGVRSNQIDFPLNDITGLTWRGSSK